MFIFITSCSPKLFPSPTSVPLLLEKYHCLQAHSHFVGFVMSRRTVGEHDGPLSRFYSQSASAVWDYILSPKSIQKIEQLPVTSVYSQSVDFFVFSETTVSRQKMSMLKVFVLLSCRHSMLVIINFKQIHVCIFHFYPRQRPILKGFATN